MAYRAMTVSAPAWLFAALVACCLSTVRAQPSGIDFSTYRPTTSATRIEPSEAPNIDGDVSDAVWSKAPVIDKFYQIEPRAGEPATRRTVAHVLYDRNAIYVSFYCYDDDPQHIPSGAKARDTNVSNGDIVRLYLDPEMTRRNAYAFEVNPRGGRLDALIQNNSDYLADWNIIWDAKTKRVADGWTVEIMVPFRSISYKAGQTDWGFDLYRLMRRNYERVRWTSAIASIPSLDVGHSGTLTNVHDITQGIGLDIQAYASLRAKHEWVAPAENDAKLVESANLYYKLTPSLTGTLTVNPDFSNTPLDQRKINTSRFALFFPETRDFFLQDAAAFEFGGVPFNTNIGDVNGMPFFSRNVGLVNGVPVPIKVGGKLSGSMGNLAVGGFSALTDGLGGAERQVLSVARVSRPVGVESKIGFIATNGDPTGASRNSVLGVDYQHRNSHVFGDKILNAHFSYLRSFSNVHSDDDEIVMGLHFPNEPWNGRFIYREIGGDFDPALGFVYRPGIRDYVLSFERFTRVTHPYIRWFTLGYYTNLTTDIDNHRQSYFSNAYVGASNLAGDLMFLNFNHKVEEVPAAFDLGGSATVTPGTYRWDYGNLYFETAFSRSYQIHGNITCCDFYSGRSMELDLYLNYRPNATWEIIPRYTSAYIDLPTGSVSIHVGILNLNLNFTPDMQLKTEAQYDNLSHSFSLSTRYRWEYSPGSEFFAAVGESSLIDKRLWHSHYASQTTQASIRIGHTLRF
jgi:hypothetical protein